MWFYEEGGKSPWLSAEYSDSHIVTIYLFFLNIKVKIENLYYLNKYNFLLQQGKVNINVVKM